MENETFHWYCLYVRSKGGSKSDPKQEISKCYLYDQSSLEAKNNPANQLAFNCNTAFAEVLGLGF